jgi:hypothetical protein
MAFSTDGKIGVDDSSTSTTALFALGERVKATDGQEYVYVQADGAITRYNYVCIDENFQAVKGTKALVDVGHQIGFAQIAFADNAYGWVAVKGSNLNALLAASCLPDVALYTTSTAGVLDDASTSQTKIDGIVAITTAGACSTNTVEVLATWPTSSAI